MELLVYLQLQMQNSKFANQQFLSSAQPIPDNCSNLRAILKAKANNIRKSYFKISTTTKQPEKPSLIFNSSHLAQPFPTGIFQNQQLFLPSAQPQHHKEINHKNFIDMFTKISKQTKEEYKKVKEVNECACKTKTIFENTFVVEKFCDRNKKSVVSFRKFSYKQLNNGQSLENRLSKKKEKNKEKISYKMMTSKIKRGSNYSRPRLSTQCTVYHQNIKNKVKTQCNYKMNHLNEQDDEPFYPLGQGAQDYSNFFSFSDLNTKTRHLPHQSIKMRHSKQFSMSAFNGESDNQQNEDILLGKMNNRYFTKKNSVKKVLSSTEKNRFNKTHQEIMGSRKPMHLKEKDRRSYRSGKLSHMKSRMKSKAKSNFVQSINKQPDIYKQLQTQREKEHQEAQQNKGQSLGPWAEQSL